MKTYPLLILSSFLLGYPLTIWGEEPILRPSSLLESPKENTQNSHSDASVRARGIIHRPDLNAVVKGGVPRLLAQVRVLPVKRSGRFIGFQLSEIAMDSLAYKAGFRVGDVIINVNKEPIGRPEQMMHILSLLPYATTLKISFERDGVTKVWTWLIS
jgi:type II secretory pathway component PulC